MSEKILRGLSSKFMQKLKEEKNWVAIIEKVKKDHTLHFQIRDNYINIYYRGCSILRLEEDGKLEIATEYFTLFDNVELKKKGSRYYGNISNFDWCKNVPLIKQSVDEYLSTSNKLEREFQ